MGDVSTLYCNVGVSTCATERIWYACCYPCRDNNIPCTVVRCRLKDSSAIEPFPASDMLLRHRYAVMVIVYFISTLFWSVVPDDERLLAKIGGATDQ